MRICVIGNSHVVAIYKAVIEKKESPCIDIDFFVFLIPNIPFIKDGRLLASHPDRILTNVLNAATEGLELNRYNYILVSAVGYWAFRNDNIDHPMFEIRVARWRVRSESAIPSPRIVSGEVFRETTRGMQEASPTIRICRELTRWFEGKIYMQPWPLPSDKLLEDHQWKIWQLYGSNSRQVVARFFQTQYSVICELAKKMGENIEVLSYPNRQWLADGFTSREYESRDPWPMNGKYGELVLHQLLSRCKWGNTAR